MKLYVPFTHVADATAIALEKYQPIFVDCSNSKWAYVDFFQDRWDEGETFLSVEHDIVPWPGLIDQIWECPHDYCWAGDQWESDTPATNHARFGIVKFTPQHMAAVSGVWKDMRARYEPLNRQDPWNAVDTHHFDYVRHHAFDVKPHQHFPGTINANSRYYAALLARKPKASHTALAVSLVQQVLEADEFGETQRETLHGLCDLLLDAK